MTNNTDENQVDKQDIVVIDTLDNTKDELNGIIVKEISGTHSYKTGEVAKKLGETPAMIGYYCREFSEHLNLSHLPGQHRTFNDENVKILKYIIYLMKDRRMTAEQTKEFLSTPQGKLFEPIRDEEDKVKIFVELISKDIKASMAEMIKEQVSICLQDIIPGTLDKSINKLSSSLLEQQSTLEVSLKEMVNKSMSSLQNMESLADDTIGGLHQVTEQLSKVDKDILKWREDHKEQWAENERKAKNGFFKKIFGTKSK